MIVKSWNARVNNYIGRLFEVLSSELPMHVFEGDYEAENFDNIYLSLCCCLKVN